MGIKIFLVVLALIWAGALVAYGVRTIALQLQEKKRAEYEKRRAAWLKAEEEEEKRREARRQALNATAASKATKGRQRI